MVGRHRAASSWDVAYRTKTEFAYARLRDAINSGELEPGQRITLRGASKWLKMSETPVREALKQLSFEGLVVIRPHAEILVAHLPLERIEEHLLIRSELEALATRIAADHITESILDELDGLIEAMDEHIVRGEMAKYSALNRIFHQTIYSCIPQTQLVTLIDMLWSEVPRARTVFSLVPDFAARSQHEHRAILRALRQGDGATAAELVRQQKLAAMTALSENSSAVTDNANARRQRPDNGPTRP